MTPRSAVGRRTRTSSASGPKFLLGFELDWTPIRIPYVGALGPGFSFNWVGSSSLAKIDLDNNSQTGNCLGTLDGCYSAESTTLTLLPMYIVAVLRVDDPLTRFGVPIVPYIKVGVDGTIWFAGNASGKTYMDKTTKQDISPSGWSWGTHLALGAALALNWLDAEAAESLARVGQRPRLLPVRRVRRLRHRHHRKQHSAPRRLRRLGLGSFGRLLTLANSCPSCLRLRRGASRCRGS